MLKINPVCRIAISLFIWVALAIPYLSANENKFTPIDQGEEALPSSELETIRADLGIDTHRFSIGLVVSDFNYEEPSLMEETGGLYGVIARYCFRNQLDGMFQTDLQVEWGELDYDGGYQDGTPLQTDTNDYLIEWRAIGGLDYTIFTNHLLTPFLGIAYRYWNDEIEGDGGYEREIAYWYIPLGFQTLSPLSPGFSIGLHLEYDLFLEGKVTSHLNHADDSLDRLYNDQLSGKGYGIQGSIQLRTLLNNQIGLLVEPFISYWDMADSEMALIYYNPSTQEGLVGLEPENTTLHYGLRVMMEF